jgi:RNA polymerase sigma-70 factor, ECF subfamily
LDVISSRDPAARASIGQAAVDDAGPGPDEPELLRGASSGSREALEELCRRNWRPVYRTFARLGFSPAEAEDLTQEVFLRAIRSLSRFENRGVPFRAYLLQIARNLARDRWRAGSRSPLPTADLPDQPLAEPGPEGLAIDAARRESLLAALDLLSADHRLVLRLRPSRRRRRPAACTSGIRLRRGTPGRG